MQKDRVMGHLKSFALATAATLAFSGAALAADMLRFPVEDAPEIVSKPVELGSGWYLRGDVSWARDNGPQVSADVAQSGTQHNWVIDLGAGYKFNNWLRADVTAGLNKQRDVSLSGAKVTCPYALNGLTTQGANPVQLGYSWDSVHDTCTPGQNAQINKLDLLFNGYVDLGTWVGATPYLGAGVGTSIMQSSTSLNYYKTSDGIYAADLTPNGTYPHIWVDNVIGLPITPQPTVGFDKQNWSRNVSHTTYNLAWALMGGVAIDVTNHAKLDVSYRYLDSGSYTSLASPVTGAVVRTKMTSQQVRVGFRYMID